MSSPIKVGSIALLRVTIVAQSAPLGHAVLRCLSMTHVVVTQAFEIGHCGELDPDAFILFADDYPPPEVVELVRRKLSQAIVRAITLVTEFPREFDVLLTEHEAAGRVAIVPQLASGSDLLDLVFGLSARLTNRSDGGRPGR